MHRLVFVMREVGKENRGGAVKGELAIGARIGAAPHLRPLAQVGEIGLAVAFQGKRRTPEDRSSPKVGADGE